MKVETESPAPYIVHPDTIHAAEERVISDALAILTKRLRKPGAIINTPKLVIDFLLLQIAEKEREVFGVIWLDARHGYITHEALFEGTATQTSVYPRELLKSGLKHNAVAAFIYHNHPSGDTEPSRADENLTFVVKDALSKADIKLLDHLIIGGTSACSLAERGLI